MDDVAADLVVRRDLTIPAAELHWQFSRSSGPGGQSVNTSDSRVQLSWRPAASRVLTAWQRDRLLRRRGAGGAGKNEPADIVVVASDSRSQWQNRRTARRQLADVVAAALAPDPRTRRRTRPTRGSVERRLDDKRRRSQTKRSRSRPEE